MTLSFIFKGTRKDGTAQLYIRFKDGSLDRADNDVRLKIEGVYIIPKLWNKTFSQVDPSHPNSLAINNKITEYKTKMLEVQNKYSLRQIDFDTVKKMLSNEESAQSIKEYIRSVFSLYKEKTHVDNCLETVITVANHLNIKDLHFNDVTEENFMRLRKKILDNAGSPHTYNTYYNNIKTVCNHAVKKKYTFQTFEFDPSWKAKVPPMPDNDSAVPDMIRFAIDNIEIKGKYRRNFLATLMEIEAVAHWLLMFSFRGIYPSDIHELTSKNLDYDFSRKIEALQKGYHDEVIFGNPHVYLHRRHKTKYPMNILISLPPIQKLISFLRQTVSLTHPSISYMNLQDGHLTIDSWIKNTEKDKVDFLKIFSITKKKNPKAFKATWDLYRKKARSIGLPTYMIARNTFQSLSDEFENTRPIGRTLLGHKDHSISAKYSDLKRPKILAKVTKAHIEILEEFETIELFNYLINKTHELFPQLNIKNYLINGEPKVIYNSYKNLIDDILNKTKLTPFNPSSQ